MAGADDVLLAVTQLCHCAFKLGIVQLSFLAFQQQCLLTGRRLGQPVLQQPDMVPMGAVPVPPGAVWIPGHYDWSPAAQNYVWIDGQFTLPPHPAAQWLAGHWQETPSSWIWIDGRWN